MTCKKMIISILMLTCIFFSSTTKSRASSDYIAEEVHGANFIYLDDAIVGGVRSLNPFLRNVWSILQRVPSKWDTSAPAMEATSEGIEITYEKHDKSSDRVKDMLVYTIPEDYTGDIVINATEDIFRILGGIYQPGEEVTLTIRVINQSGNLYSYVPDSFTVSTENYSKYTLSSASDAYGFDGSPILLGHTTKRSGNSALRALYGLESTADLTQQNVCDTSLAPVLKRLGYENGTQDLGNYYLDFYNDEYDLSAERLEDFPDDIILEIFSGENLREVETCPEIAALGYNWFYNRILYAFPDNIEVSDTGTDYTIGSYMRNEINYESYCEAAFAEIGTDEYTLQPLNLYLSETRMSGAYRDINLNLCVGFKLKQVE